LSEEEKIALMSAHPKLIERPIVIVDGRRAVLARPAEKLAALFGG
ncbi:MAG: arsenate reductase (glutaredoxin), partial [Zetaproteobacteria bacterium]